MALKDYSKPKSYANGIVVIDCIRSDREFKITNSEWLTMNKFYKCKQCKGENNNEKEVK